MCIDTQLSKAAETYSGSCISCTFEHGLQYSSHIMLLHCQVTVPLPTTLEEKGKKTILNLAQFKPHLFYGRAAAQAVSHEPLTTEAWV